MPDAELRCLLLFEGTRYLTPKEIAFRMNVVKSRVTKIINGLLKKRYIQKIKDPKDSRIALLSLTSQGRKKMTEIIDFNDRIHKEVLISMKPEQRNIILANLDILNQAMESAKGLMMRDSEP